MENHRGLTLGMLLLALGLPCAGLTVQNDGMGRALVTVKDETVTASKINEKTPSKTYYNGIRELSMASYSQETVLRLDTALKVQYASFPSNAGLCLEVANEHGCLTLTDTGSSSPINSNQHITVRLDPDTPPIGDISWLIFDATLQPRSVRMDNDEPFVLECTIPDLTNRGIITSTDDLNEGEVGLLLGGLNKPEHAAMYSFTSLSVVARIPSAPAPEPATGTLSLLAFTALAARRRRK